MRNRTSLLGRRLDVLHDHEHLAWTHQPKRLARQRLDRRRVAPQPFGSRHSTARSPRAAAPRAPQARLIAAAPASSPPTRARRRARRRATPPSQTPAGSAARAATSTAPGAAVPYSCAGAVRSLRHGGGGDEAVSGVTVIDSGTVLCTIVSSRRAADSRGHRPGHS